MCFKSAIFKNYYYFFKKNYRYFGAAKNLPGVRELLEERERQTTPAGPMKVCF